MISTSANFAPLSNTAIRKLVIAAVAKVNAASIEDVERDITLQGGDLAVKSHFATVVIADLETKFGVTLADQDELEQLTRTSINSLTRLVERQLHLARPKRQFKSTRTPEAQAK